ncbi:RTPR, ribonucleoside-triphosphate reductase, adenosylcobalamin-dependent [uncultured Caudovirales phage]|uniref:RTPR, ribonucleoside-triphosphate reductase, adenosylcobalamin-dependent n=1 Tax=uncultured Caudovirales phage TaxID=2100421 RepID=A0A6J7WM05_9CAUD|nr:RTPR, ribonucleoside-triphosphate reductase, adenosylcobalamin-dependent [uncultured Caudovirales phage]
MNQYQEYIHKSRYAKYLPEQGRREDWNETVQRYVDYIFERNPKLNPVIKKDIYNAIHGMHIMPSMRAMMTSGKAADRDNTCIYNCSYLPVDDVKSFDEAMFILLCGTGVGFSVESKYTNKLPEVPERLFESEHFITVADSKEGWAKAYRMLLASLYAGEIPKWDVSKVRAAGTPLKTFGGRASGPEPLVDLFQFTIKTFRGALGRKLNTLECHDLMCKIGEVVVVGGVRRSAMISLSDLNDERIRHAKSGNWWETHPHRALANNSAVYDTKPTVGTFLEEWTSLYNSHSGERGIFNREAAKHVVAKYGKRDPGYEFGTNPCSEIVLRPYQFCNLTEVMVRPDDTLESLKQKVRMAAILGTIQATFTHFPYLRKVWQRNTEEERLLGVSLTGIYDHEVMGSVRSSPLWLQQLREVANEANAEFADILGIPRSTAITAVKPSGTVSQLTDTASGIHPRHAPFYIRRVRGDNKDPLTQFLISQGVPAEPCVMKPNTTTVFSFPQRAPEGLVTRDDVTAIKHLELWLTYQRHWCEHKPSVTISVTENEWPSVGAFVWEYFDEMSGVSFLPHDGGTYRQAPYETCDEAQYEKMKAEMPAIDWHAFAENRDNVEGAQMLACVAGVCEL